MLHEELTHKDIKKIMLKPNIETRKLMMKGYIGWLIDHLQSNLSSLTLNKILQSLNPTNPSSHERKTMLHEELTHKDIKKIMLKPNIGTRKLMMKGYIGWLIDHLQSNLSSLTLNKILPSLNPTNPSSHERKTMLHEELTHKDIKKIMLKPNIGTKMLMMKGYIGWLIDHLQGNLSSLTLNKILPSLNPTNPSSHERKNPTIQ